MKRQFMFGTMLAAVMAVGVGAQQPTAGQAGQSSDQSSRPVTVTGCLQSAPSSGAPATGDTTSKPQSGSQAQYILTNATPATAGTSATGTAGTGATPGAGSTKGSAGAAKTFRLQGGDSSDLQKYVNSKVEVTGTLASSSERGTSGAAGSATGAGTGTGTGSATGSTASGATSGMSGSMQALRVTSVRQVAESCSGGEAR